MTSIRTSIIFGILCVTELCHADSLPRRGEVDPRIRTATYSADEVYRLSGFVGYHVDLEFAPTSRSSVSVREIPKRSRTALTITFSR
jgi:hypothetical protein